MKQVIIGLLLAVCLWLLPGVAAANGSNEIQNLIEETPAGGELILEKKTYKGNVLITKPMTVKGKNGTKVHGDGTGNVIEIESPDVTLENLEIRYSGRSRDTSEEFAGVRVLDENITLKNLDIAETYHGIYINQSKHIVIKNNTIVGLDTPSLGDMGSGIHIVRSGDNHIEGNSIKQSRDGIYVEYSDNNEIINNTVKETRYGLHYMYSNFNRFEANKFIQNTGGAAIMHSDNIELRNNSFSYNHGSRAFGLIIQGSREIDVIDNKFYLNQRGLYLEQSTSNMIEGNTFFKNKIGIEVWSSSTSHFFIKNSFHENSSDVIAVGGESNNQFFKNGVGNYWNTPMLDLDQDGTGDREMTSTSAISQLIEENELVYLFLESPAMTVYEQLNNLLSGQQTMALDKYPLMKENPSANEAWMFGGAGILAAGIYMWKRRRRM
ncbi:nitrous oxide reductase family maturation protein NosD [Halobacillus sp. MO56]